MTPLLTQRDLAALTKLSPRTIERLRCVGGGPKFVRVRGSVRYRIEDVEAWIASRVVSNTSEELSHD
jgi:predicted DNA-binding transcriptional regulator AlpA